ncbi:hypothetical protein HY251_06460 [bacterium]|nr:hypothetical protein [bacterium]
MLKTTTAIGTQIGAVTRASAKMGIATKPQMMVSATFWPFSPAVSSRARGRGCSGIEGMARSKTRSRETSTRPPSTSTWRPRSGGT